MTHKTTLPHTAIFNDLLNLLNMNEREYYMAYDEKIGAVDTNMFIGTHNELMSMSVRELMERFSEAQNRINNAQKFLAKEIKNAKTKRRVLFVNLS